MSRIEELQISVVAELLKTNAPRMAYHEFTQAIEHILEASIANERVRESLED
jgi:hypothetical protein